MTKSFRVPVLRMFNVGRALPATRTPAAGSARPTSRIRSVADAAKLREDFRMTTFVAQGHHVRKLKPCCGND